MQPFHYSVERFRDEWVISVDDARILTCKTRKTALDTARRAAASAMLPDVPTVNQTRAVKLPDPGP
jgi:hypothetical protein